jgi:hypothetical protein
MTPADLRACLLRLLAALEGRALAGLGPQARAGVAAAQVRLILMRLEQREAQTTTIETWNPERTRMQEAEPQVAERYPIDYDALKKGDSIGPGRLVEILGVRQTHPRWQLKLLALQQEIERELWDRGKPWTVAIRKGFIAVLTDSEAAEYNRRRFLSAQRSLHRSHRRNSAVDQANLAESERAMHHRAIHVEGVQLAAMLAARRELGPRPYERQFPARQGPQGLKGA